MVHGFAMRRPRATAWPTSRSTLSSGSAPIGSAGWCPSSPHPAVGDLGAQATALFPRRPPGGRHGTHHDLPRRDRGLLCDAAGVSRAKNAPPSAPIRKTLTHVGEPLEPPPFAPAPRPPTDWGEFVQVHEDRDVVQATPDELPMINIQPR